jgi:acyl-CoA hydrolase
MEAKSTSCSRTVMTDLVLPPDTNNYGTIFGGKVMAYVDKIASIASMRHARQPVVTASSDSLDFLRPIKSGEAIRLEAFVSYTHQTSMEIFVKIESENLMTGEVKLTGTSYLTFVALGADGRPALVPMVIPETDEERFHFETAPDRFLLRRQRKEERMMGLESTRGGSTPGSN